MDEDLQYDAKIVEEDEEKLDMIEQDETKQTVKIGV